MTHYIKYLRYSNYRTTIIVPAAFHSFYNAIPKSHRLSSEFLNSHYNHLCDIYWENIDLIGEMLINRQTAILYMQSTKQGIASVAKFLMKNAGYDFELMDGLSHERIRRN